jgi:hypothetical protein
MATMDELIKLSERHRQRRCKIAEALAEYDQDGRTIIEEALGREDITDDAIRRAMQADGIEAMADARGPQSVSFHRAKRCICFREGE